MCPRRSHDGAAVPAYPAPSDRPVSHPASLVRGGLRFAEGAVARTFPGLVRRRYRRPVFEANRLAEKLARAARIADPKTLESIVSANVREHGVELVEGELRKALAELGDTERPCGLCHLLLGAMRALPAYDKQCAIRLGETYVDAVDFGEVARMLAKLESSVGRILRPLQLLDRGDRASRGTLYRQLKTNAQILHQGMAFAAVPPSLIPPENEQRILYYVNQSQPHHSSGYAVRTQWLVRHLLERGWDVGAYARLGYPIDRNDFVGVNAVPEHAEVDGIPYTFSPDKNGYRTLDAQAYHDAAVATLMRQAKAYRPALIHTASNYIVGLAGTETARRMAIPSIYEMRGLWHMTRASRQPEYQDSEHYCMAHLLEIQAANSADHVFAITEGVRDIVVAGGISPAKVTVVPNAVDTEQFAPQPRDEKLASELGFAEEVVIGYVGSFSEYEGLDYLLRAVAELRASCDMKFRVLLVGDGIGYDALVALAGELQLSDIVTFTGRVSYEDVGGYYSLIDIVTYPRKGIPVCEVVSPLKPYEAMAMEKAVVVSDVGALAAMVQHYKTGLIHRRDDVASLRAALETLLLNASLRVRLGREGRYWVKAHRTWAQIAGIVDEVYRRLIRQGRNGGASAQGVAGSSFDNPPCPGRLTGLAR